jgi:hypothetical protein
MNSKYFLSRRSLIAFVVSLAAAFAVQAATLTVNGTDVTLLSSPNLTATDLLQASGTNAVNTKTQNSSGSLGQFDPTLGVLTGVSATLSVPTTQTSLTKSGGGGSATVTSTWSLGGNSSGTTLNSYSNNGSDTTWNSISLTSSAGNWNNFVGTGNVATNSFTTKLVANKTSSDATPATGTSINKSLIGSESVVYTYLTHANASFDSGSDGNSRTINAGQPFSIFNLGGGDTAKLDFVRVDCVSGDCGAFNVTMTLQDLAGGSSASGNAALSGAPGNYLATYSLVFSDDTAVGATSTHLQNSLSLTVAVPEPAEWAMLLAGLLVVGFIARQRKSMFA